MPEPPVRLHVEMVYFDKLSQGYAVDAFIRERQQDVFYVYVRITCPALFTPPTRTVPVAIDGRSTFAIESGGADNQAQGIIGRDAAIRAARFVCNNAEQQLEEFFRSCGCPHKGEPHDAS